MRSFGRGVLGLLVVGAVASAAGAGTGPKLELSSTVWDFGDVWSGNKVSFKLVLKNIGDAPLEIARLMPSCGCTAATPEKSVLQPGESTNANIEVDTKGKQGKFESNVGVITNDPSAQGAKLEIRGTVKRAITLNPIGGLVMRGIDPNARLQGQLTIENHEPEAMKLELQDFKSDKFELEVQEIEAGRKCIIIGRSKAPLSYGTTTEWARFSTGVAREPMLQVPVSATVIERVSLTPKAIYIHATLDKKTERAVSIYHYGGGAFEVTGVKSNNPALSATFQPTRAPTHELNLPIPPTAVVEMKVHLPLGKDIPQAGSEIEISTTDPDYPKVILLVTTDNDRWRKVMMGPSEGPTKK